MTSGGYLGARGVGDLADAGRNFLKSSSRSGAGLKSCVI